jgi:hypothetical protein
LFDDVLAEIQHKHEDKKATIAKFIHYCKEETSKKIKALDIKMPKQRELVQEAMIAHVLNSKLEQNHSIVFSGSFKHNLIYSWLSKRIKEESSNDF